VIPLSCIFAGLSVIVDRQAGAQRELLAAPIPRAYLVLGNLIVAMVLSALQAIVLVGLTALRGGLIDPHGQGLHAIWGAGNPTTQAFASLAVVALYAVALTAISIRVFTHAAVK
jgi:ABC-type multidrug transport system permease subunit